MRFQKVSTQNLRSIAKLVILDNEYFPYVSNRQLLDGAGEVLLSRGDTIEITIPPVISLENIQTAITNSGYRIAVSRASFNFHSRVGLYRKSDSTHKAHGNHKRLKQLIIRLTSVFVGGANDFDLHLLGLTEIPSEVSILKSSYIELIKTHHPDYGGSEKSLWGITDAYEKVLSRM